MKSVMYQILFLLLMQAVHMQAQIIIDQGDMPFPGDTLRVSSTTTVPPDFALTGRDTTWDFSMLEPMNQRVDTFVAANSAPAEYWLFFVLNGAANLACPRGSGEFFPDMPISKYYNFYKKTNQEFVDAGFALLIQGLPLPAKYDVPDKYYTFPLDTASAWASVSAVSFAYPGMFYFSTQRERNSFVDGWGTVITPFGSFESLRIRSELMQFDSIFIDSLGFGFGLNRNITEYKWMAKNMGIPLLQINSEGLLTTATYRDSTRMSTLPLAVSLGPDTTVSKGAVITLSAAVTGGNPPYNYFWSTLESGPSVTVTVDTTQVFVVLVVDGLNRFASDMKQVTVFSPGIEERQPGRLTIRPNPSDGRFVIQFPGSMRNGVLHLYDPTGRRILDHHVTAPATSMKLDLAGIPDGVYMVRLQSDQGSYYSKVTVVR